MSVELLVIAVIKSASDVLLVREATATGDGTAWVLPGGQVASGELAVEALAREIKEETGLTTEGLPKLVAIGQIVNPTTIRRDEGEIPAAGGSALVLAYEVTSFFGALDCSQDPDGDVAEPARYPWDTAVSLLAQHPFPFVRSVTRSALALDDGNGVAVAQCYVRRNHDGEDAPLVLP